MSKACFEFVVYIIHACAKKWKMTPGQVYQLIEQKGCVSQYLVPFYEVLHTQGTNYLVCDIEEYMKKRGVVL